MISLCQFFRFFLIIQLGLVCQLNAQIRFKHLTIDDGLSQNSVVSIAEDSIGNLWFATQDGLNKYNGQFKKYPLFFNDHTFDDHAILGQVMVDHNNRVWAIDKNGDLYTLDHEADTFMLDRRFANLLYLFEDSKGRMWAIERQDNSSTIKLMDERLEIGSLELGDMFVQQIFEISEELFLIAGSEGVFELELKNDLIKKGNRILDYATACIRTDHEGQIWYATYSNGLFKANQYDDPQKHQIEAIPDGTIIYDFHFDSKAQAWIGTYGSGLYLIDSSLQYAQNYIPIKRQSSSLGYHDILDVFEDHNGNLWFGFDGRGVDCYDPSLMKFNMLKDSEMDKDVDISVIRAIFSNDDFMALGTEGNGVTIYDRKNDSWKTYDRKTGLSGQRVVAVCGYAETNLLWVSSHLDGINVCSYDNQKLEVRRSFLKGQSVRSFVAQDEHTVWAGTNKGHLILLDEERGPLEDYHFEGKFITHLAHFDSQSLLVSTYQNGVWLFDKLNKTFEPLGGESSLGPQKIKSTLLIKASKVLICTFGQGIVIYDTKTNRFNPIANKSKGLLNDVIYGALRDPNGNVWISSNKGISMVKLNDNCDSLDQITNYDLHDGLQSYEFNTGAFFMDDHSNIYFGGIEGLNWFNPLTIKKNEIPPSTSITAVHIHNQKVSLSKAITIPASKNNFTISFSNMQLSFPEGSRFKYRLSGYTDEWTEASIGQAHYMNIPAGRYTFEVLSANYDGLWSTQARSLIIKVKQHWFNSVWFYSLISLFIIGLATFGILTYLDRYKTELRLRQKQFEAENLQHLNSLKSRLYSEISHEIRTPLTLIKANARKLAHDMSHEQEYQLEAIERHTHSVLDLVNQMLDLVNIDANQYKLNSKPNDIIFHLRTFTEVFETKAVNEEKMLFLELENSELWIELDVSCLRKIIYNLLQNAIKFTPAGGKIVVSQSMDDSKSWLIIQVEDSGVGIHEDDISRIFDRYYKTFDIDENLGNGIGMALTKELVLLMGGSIQVESQVGEGSIFTIKLPIVSAQSQDHDEEILINQKGTSLLPKSKQVLKEDSHSIDKPRLMVLEDNQELQSYYHDLLKSKYNLIFFSNGADGWNHLQNNQVDFILSDGVMPKMSGYEFCKMVKEDWLSSHIPFILVSGLSDVEDRNRAYKLGIDVFLTKPFEDSELLLVIENLLRKRKNNEQFYRRILIQEGDLKREADVLPSKDIEFIENFQSLVLEDFNSYSIEQVASRLNMSRSQMHRKLKALVGMSATDYISHLRIEKAKILLSTTDLRINEIAFKLGFSDPGYFGKLFKKVTKSSPQNWRNKS